MQNAEKGKIIILNGTSSSGKTSLTKKLQEVLDEPYFHLSFDKIGEMAPVRFFEGENRREMLMKTAAGLHHCIAALSNAGLNVIVDHVFELKTWLCECVDLLYDLPVILVGVHCPLDELERRERERGDRMIGLAKLQLNLVHEHMVYDIEIDTFEYSLSDCANKIIETVKEIKHPNAIEKLKAAML